MEETTASVSGRHHRISESVLPSSAAEVDGTSATVDSLDEAMGNLDVCDEYGNSTADLPGTLVTLDDIPDGLLADMLGFVDLQPRTKFRMICSRWNYLLTSGGVMKTISFDMNNITERRTVCNSSVIEPEEVEDRPLERVFVLRRGVPLGEGDSARWGKTDYFRVDNAETNPVKTVKIQNLSMYIREYGSNVQNVLLYDPTHRQGRDWSAFQNILRNFLGIFDDSRLARFILSGYHVYASMLLDIQKSLPDSCQIVLHQTVISGLHRWMFPQSQLAAGYSIEVEEAEVVRLNRGLCHRLCNVTEEQAEPTVEDTEQVAQEFFRLASKYAREMYEEEILELIRRRLIACWGSWPKGFLTAGFRADVQTIYSKLEPKKEDGSLGLDDFTLEKLKMLRPLTLRLIEWQLPSHDHRNPEEEIDGQPNYHVVGIDDNDDENE
ncbi:hypothetical protein RvY_17223 [Ramazzottius varieornatus]|uniref:F-box domain-containing protein n=1 Tax=Ramazzottius varieornatus TaxID=947166 RepID=A0A1D1W1D3_RAMVA|nr:hypothetical protein RvY_17223 [Ramazzottius varieornatus]